MTTTTDTFIAESDVELAEPVELAESADESDTDDIDITDAADADADADDSPRPPRGRRMAAGPLTPARKILLRRARTSARRIVTRRLSRTGYTTNVPASPVGRPLTWMAFARSTGLSPTYAPRVLQGLFEPSAEKAMLIARGRGMSLDELAWELGIATRPPLVPSQRRPVDLDEVSRTEIAKATGYTVSDVCRFLGPNRHRPHLRKLVAIAEAMWVSCEDLYYALWPEEEPPMRLTAPQPRRRHGKPNKK